MTPKSLTEWLDLIEKIHPLSMDLKMERISQVARIMNLLKPKAFVITVAGTNGKGSTATTIASLMQSVGLKTGLYTSPHIHTFNERIKINQNAIDDCTLVHIFEKITSLRKDITLTYFEYATLAALEYFSTEQCEVIVLEVGLGGRFDATNIIDADIAVITPIGIDHVLQLGNNRETIAKEKAGIFRKHQTIIISESSPPLSLLACANLLNANIILRDQNFWFSKHAPILNDTNKKENDLEISQPKWDFSFKTNNNLAKNDKTPINSISTHFSFQSLNAPVLHGDHQYDNAACALATLLASPFADRATHDTISQGLANVQIEGRLEIHILNDQTWIFDVTHNPHGATTIANWLKDRNFGTISVILGMLEDKDANGLALALKPFINHWYFASLNGERGQTSQALCDKIAPLLQTTKSNQSEYLSCYANVESACLAAAMNKHHITLVIGSFHTVADALVWYKGTYFE